MSSALSFNCRYNYSGGFELEAAFEMGGGVTALFGPSGSGKTTILSLIAGLLRPTAGSIRIGDELVVDTTAKVSVPAEQRRVGFLFQDHALFPHLRVKRNIEYGAKRCASATIPLKRLIETLELQDLLQRYPGSLSGGQQQRVALARALASGPSVLLLDEPLTSVEAPLRERISGYLQRIVNEHEIPVLLVSHNRPFVDRLADRVIEIQDGRLIPAAN
ncbi:ATP-binding cassette domain-containing protein [Rubinisphaera margarita]|uniref:ATP-binding cassette domain-containing protein n=1 Tax=Rubinisphaera margarita TaxID=2909586 RepID=UPI001EE79A63|nr:ATP-binding cassette domain-containing protein [Rubinisphaera margarita]MCG6156394.1 ATP-binding cassette domain-containing protein [Rubinisphaera margarita]